MTRLAGCSPGWMGERRYDLRTDDLAFIIDSQSWSVSMTRMRQTRSLDYNPGAGCRRPPCPGSAPAAAATATLRGQTPLPRRPFPRTPHETRAKRNRSAAGSVYRLAKKSFSGPISPVARQNAAGRSIDGRTRQRLAITVPQRPALPSTPGRVANWHAGPPLAVQTQEKPAFASAKAACQRPPKKWHAGRLPAAAQRALLRSEALSVCPPTVVKSGRFSCFAPASGGENRRCPKCKPPVEL
jgi:hypothetical protein